MDEAQKGGERDKATEDDATSWMLWRPACKTLRLRRLIVTFRPFGSTVHGDDDHPLKRSAESRVCLPTTRGIIGLSTLDAKDLHPPLWVTTGTGLV